MIKPGYKTNLETIIKAAKNGDLALVECTDKKSGRPVIALCAIGFDGKEYIITPMAKLFDGNPFEELNPPTELKNQTKRRLK
jgi:hypothetical protein